MKLTSRFLDFWMTNLPKSLIERISFPTNRPLGDVVGPLVRRYTGWSVAELWIQPADRSAYAPSRPAVPGSPFLPRGYRVLEFFFFFFLTIKKFNRSIHPRLVRSLRSHYIAAQNTPEENELEYRVEIKNSENKWMHAREIDTNGKIVNCIFTQARANKYK